jgi:hypothetical protein
MKKILFLALLFNLKSIAQEETIVKIDTTYWDKGALFGIQFSQSSFYQWTAGGENSIALAGLHKSHANYLKGNKSWTNNLDINYGIIKQGSRGIRKTDDRIEFNSAYGQRANNNWFYSGSFNFRTQFSPGFNTKNDLISDLFSPAYLTLAIGMDYKPNKDFSFALSPLAGKITIVTNDSLKTIGAFGVDPGSMIRYEFGGLMRVAWKREILTNVLLDTKLQLFSNYVDNPQNIDVNWDALITFKVNKYLSFNILAVLIYDHDIMVPKGFNPNGTAINGRGIQFKEVLSLGITYKI